MQISFRSRSDLVLDADHALDFYLISFYRRVSRFVAFQTKVARLCLGADFREGDEDSNFSIFRVRRFSEWPEPLH